MGVALMLFIKESLRPYVYDIRVSSTGVGALGIMGKKGAVAIGFRVHDSSLCFVSSHLAAGRKNLEHRSDNYRSIVGKLTLLPPIEGEDHAKPWHRNGHRKFSAREGLSILDYDVVFWVGDLNYHIDPELSIEEVFRLVENSDWRSLLRRDQLVMQRETGQAFSGFREAELSFAPTYKYMPGSDDYDRREEKLRAPAWCDRVQWYSSDGSSEGMVRPIYYNRAELTLSDHKPVLAILEAGIRRVNETAEAKHLRDFSVHLDREENGLLPQIDINQNIFDFDRVYVSSCTSVFI